MATRRFTSRQAGHAFNITGVASGPEGFDEEREVAQARRRGRRSPAGARAERSRNAQLTSAPGRLARRRRPAIAATAVDDVTRCEKPVKAATADFERV